MARRKTHHKKHTTRRRKRSHMSGIGGMGEGILAVAAGVVAGKAITKFAGASLNPKIMAAAQIAGGIFLPKMVKGNFGQGMGAGLIANGTGQLMSSMGILSGLGMDSMDGIDDGVYHVAMNGTSDLSALNGSDEMSGTDALKAINGTGNVSKELSVLNGVSDAYTQEMSARFKELFNS